MEESPIYAEIYSSQLLEDVTVEAEASPAVLPAAGER